MKKLLVLAKSFAPINNCGAIPNTGLVRYLCREPLQVTVLTGPLSAWDSRDPALLEGLEQVTILRVPNSRLYERTLGAWRRRLTKSGRKEQLKGRRSPPALLAQSLFFWLRDLDWYGQARHYVRTHPDFGPFDAVFSTYPEEDALKMGRFLRKQGLAKAWIADFRDPMWYAQFPRGSRRLRQRRMDRYGREADFVTVVSHGAAKKLHVDEQKLQVLSNGFDPARAVADQSADDGVLRLCYAGSLYGGKRDLSALFAALSRLLAAGQMDRRRLELWYAGAEWPVFAGTAARWDLADCCRDCGSLPHSRVLELLAQCDVPLVCTHNTEEDQGVVTGKVFELLQTGKPLLALVTGTRPHSELGALLADCRAGFTWEQAAGPEADRKLEQWLLERYREKQQRGRLKSTLDPEKRAAYGYDRLAHTLYIMLENL